MATVDDLSVRVSASVADFTTGMSRAENALSDVRDDAMLTAGSMQVLQGRMDEAGDEAQTAGMKAGASSGGFTALAGSAASAEISFSSLSVVTATTLIPSLLALSTVIAPLTAALGGFITVAASIVGIGLVGFLGAAVTNTERLKSTFTELKNTVLNEFAPVFDVFAGVLDRLMQRLTEIVPQLVPAEDVIRRIAGQFESLGMAIINALPAFMDLAVTLTDRFLPPFVEWVERILPKVPGMLQNLIPTMVRVGQTLQPLAQAFMRIAPTMTEFGMTVLNVVVPAATRFVNAWDGAMQAINGMDKGTGKLVATLTILSPIIAKIGLALAGLSAPILAAVGAIAVFVSAWTRGWDKTKQTISRGVSAITQGLGRVGTWLKNNGPRIVQRAITLFQNIIRDAASWIQENGPGLMKEAFKKIGEGIRFIAKDIYNAVTGSGDSILKNIITGFGSWLISEGPGILKKGAKLAFDGIIAAATGLTAGLIGSDSSTFKGLIGDIGSYLRTGAKTLLSNAASFAFNALKDSALEPFVSLKDRIGEILDSIAERIDNVTNKIPDASDIPGSNIAGNAGATVSNVPGLDSGGYIEEGGLAQLHAGEQVVPAAQVDRDGGGGTQRIELVLEERTDVVEGRIQEGAEMVVERRERRTQRNSGRNLNPR